MSTLITPAVLTAARVKIVNAFNDALKSKKSFTNGIGLLGKVPAGVTNVYQWIAQTNTRMREWPEGTARVVNGTKERAYSQVTKRYENTIGIGRMQLEANIESGLNYLAEISAQRATSIIKLGDDLALEVLANGQSMLCMDGQSFFDTDHPVSHDAAGAQSNYSASGMALNPANFMTVRATMMSYQDEDGRVVDVVPDTLVVPPALEKAALECVEAVNNATGATNVARGKAEVKVWGEISKKINDTTWFLGDFRPGVGAEALLEQDLDAPEIADIMALNSEHVFMFDEFLMGARARKSVIPGEWKRLYKASA